MVQDISQGDPWAFIWKHFLQVMGQSLRTITSGKAWCPELETGAIKKTGGHPDLILEPWYINPGPHTSSQYMVMSEQPGQDTYSMSALAERQV